MALVGEPGVGKSRVIREFVEGPWMEGAILLEGRPVAYRKTPSWMPVMDALRALLRDRPARRGAHHPGEDHRQGPGARSRARARAPGPARARRSRAGGPGVARARSAAAPAPHPGRGAQRAAGREPAPAGGLRGGGSPAHRRGDPGAARQPGGPAAGHAPADPGRLPAGVPAPVGQQARLRADPDRPVLAGDGARAAREPARLRSRVSPRSRRCWSSAPTATRSSSRRACGRSSRRRP